MRYFVIILLGLSMSICAIAQKKTATKYSTKSKKAIALFEEGRKEIMQEFYEQSLVKFEAAKKIDNKFVEAYFMCADAYHELGNYRKQCENLRIAIGLDSTMFVSGYYQMGLALCYLGEFSEATEWFELYKHHAGKNTRRYNVDAWLKKATFAKNLMEHPVPFEPHRISQNISNEYDSYWPSLTLDEEELVFTMLVPRDTAAYRNNKRLQHNSINFHEDFYISRKLDGEWQPISPIRGINTENNEGAQALSADGRWMFFTACGRQDSKGSCDLYFSHRTASGWSKPINVGAPINSPYWESQPCFSADGQTLYFVSNRPGGKGGNDIWAAKIVNYDQNGVPIFGNVVNLGDSINTKGTETSPFLHPDNQTLYFSSDYWPGMGGLDIFMSRRKSDGSWSTPVNIGYPINTQNDNNGLVINAAGNTAYLSTTRILDDGTPRIELLSFEMPQEIRPQPVSYIKGHVYDIKTKAPLDANLELIRLDNGTKQVDTQSDASNGNFIVNLPAGHDYALIVSRSGYLFHSQSFALETAENTSKPLLLDIPLSPLIKGEKVALRNVFFDFNSTELKEESFIELDKLVKIMNDSPNVKIEIGGHTDNVGTAEYNRRLSEGRAQTTVNYLISKGINKTRISYKGYGFTMPIDTNETEEGRALNRRIEAKVIE